MAMGDLQATAFALGCVLQDGEPADSERAVAQAGPRAAVMLHRAADEALLNMKPTQALLAQRPELEGYVALARTYEPKDAPYLENHRGHLMFVKPAERKYVTADLIRATSFTATEGEIRQRIGALARCRLQPSSRSSSCPARKPQSPTGRRIAKAFA